VLQQALATDPVLIAGRTTVDDEPAQLLLIRREIGIPSADGGSNTFSLDHLFVDRDGVPVPGEVKRSTDTRIRREVVGQMLDYVANAAAYWRVGDLRRALEATARGAASSGEPMSGDDLVAAVAADGDVEEFWRRVETNLRAGRLRMIFEADELPAELVRVIRRRRCLRGRHNAHLSPSELLAWVISSERGDDRR
jgi:hypothetical protein